MPELVRKCTGQTSHITFDRVTPFTEKTTTLFQVTA